MPTTYTLSLPFDKPPAALWGNQREGHWAARHRAAKVVRDAVVTLGRQAKIPKADHLTVRLVWAPGDRRSRDSDNLAGLLKVCADALGQSNPRWTHLGLVPDDSDEYVTKEPPLIMGPPAKGMWLYVTVREPA